MKSCTRVRFPPQTIMLNAGAKRVDCLVAPHDFIPYQQRSITVSLEFNGTLNTIKIMSKLVGLPKRIFPCQAKSSK